MRRSPPISALRVAPAATLALLTLALALAAPARGQSAFSVLGPGLVSSADGEVGLTGSLAVSFHGDPGTGCAGRGLCAYSGTVVWRPPADPALGSLTVETFRRHGRVSYSAQLMLPGEMGAGPEVAASVRRELPGQAAGTCADASEPDSLSTLAVHGGLIALGVLGPGSSVLATRCAGPLGADVAAVLPAAALSIRSALRGHRRIDLAGAGSFAAAGLAGTVTSTLGLRLGDVYSTQVSGKPPRHAPRSSLQRIVSEPLTLVQASGGLTAQVHGAATPDVCGVLDSCGLRGTVSLQPRPIAAQGELVALGPARRPYRDFLAALALSRRGRASGIHVLADLGWEAGGVVAEDLTQGGGGQCRDTTPLGGGYVVLDVGRKRARAQYQAVGVPRARCPGPELGASANPSASAPFGSAGLASGAIPRPGLGRRQFSIVLRAARSFTDDGYLGRLDGSLALTLRRGRPVQRVVTQSGG